MPRLRQRNEVLHVHNEVVRLLHHRVVKQEFHPEHGNGRFCGNDRHGIVVARHLEPAHVVALDKFEHYGRPVFLIDAHASGAVLVIASLFALLQAFVQILQDFVHHDMHIVFGHVSPSAVRT